MEPSEALFSTARRYSTRPALPARTPACAYRASIGSPATVIAIAAWYCTAPVSTAALIPASAKPAIRGAQESAYPGAA